MSLATVIDAMLAAGCTAEQLAAVVKAHEAEREKAAVAKRAKDAERQRKSRLSRNVTVTSSDNHGQGVTPPCSPLSLSPIPPNPNPPIPPTTLLDGRADELYAALGEHANNRANGSFLVLSEPINWINAGCDFDLDVLPTIRSLSAKARRITTWRFFDSAVFEARDRRLAPAPDIQPRQSSPPRQAAPGKRTFMDAYKDLEHELETRNYDNVVELPGNGGRS